MASAGLDCAFLAAVIGISTLPYVRGLGFYYDDYSVLAQLNAAHDQSLVGLYHAVRPLNGQRPLQSLTFAALDRLFGLNPLGYHIVNAFLLVAVAWLLYLVLRELRLPRLLCVALPLVYSTLPHYATNRFWLDAFQITLSGAFYLLSFYAGLRALRARPAALAGWLMLAVAAMAASLFAYEVVFPLFALQIGVLWWAARRSPRQVPFARWITIGGLAAAIVVVGVVKATLVAEHGQNGYQVGFQNGLAHHLAYLVSGSIKLNAGSYFLAVPYVLWWIMRHHLTAANAGAAGAAGLLAFGYVWWIGRRDREALIGARHWRDCVRRRPHRIRTRLRDLSDEPAGALSQRWDRQSRERGRSPRRGRDPRGGDRLDRGAAYGVDGGSLSSRRASAASSRPAFSSSPHSAHSGRARRRSSTRS